MALKYCVKRLYFLRVISVLIQWLANLLACYWNSKYYRAVCQLYGEHENLLHCLRFLLLGFHRKIQSGKLALYNLIV